MLKYLCLFSLLISCSDIRNKALYNERIKEIKEELALHDQSQDSLMFSAYMDDNARINVPFAIENKKVLVIKVSNFDCDECMDMVMNEIAEGKWAKQLPVEVWYQGALKNCALRYKDWYEKVRKDIQFREVSSELINLSSNNKQKPYLFIYDTRSKEITHIFFPMLGKEQAVNKYFQIIRSKIHP